MQIEEVTDEKGFAALKPSWQELVTRSTMATPSKHGNGTTALTNIFLMDSSGY